MNVECLKEYHILFLKNRYLFKGYTPYASFWKNFQANVGVREVCCLRKFETPVQLTGLQGAASLSCGSVAYLAVEN